VLGDVVLNELHQYGAHIDAIRRGCSLKGVVEIDFKVDIHSLYPFSFLLLDRTHLLPLEKSLCGFEYPPPVLGRSGAAAITTAL
jgi:hypothetical protein